MNTIKAATNFVRPRGFTYVMDSTLWQCDTCGERVPNLARRRHHRRCPGLPE
jgi:hypothetical protein